MLCDLGWGVVGCSRPVGWDAVLARWDAVGWGCGGVVPGRRLRCAAAGAAPQRLPPSRGDAVPPLSGPCRLLVVRGGDGGRAGAPPPLLPSGEGGAADALAWLPPAASW